MNTIPFPHIRKLEVESMRRTASDILGWAETFEAAADKALQGVRSARKVETATFRYGRFMGTYLEGRFITSMITQHRLEDSDLTKDQRRALVAISDALSIVRGTLDSAMPWACLPSPAAFKLSAIGTLEAVLSQMILIKAKCSHLLGECTKSGAVA